LILSVAKDLSFLAKREPTSARAKRASEEDSPGGSVGALFHFPFRRKAKGFFLLGIVSFLNDLSSEMITPILPMFITALGGRALLVGLIGG